jgi:hypothetical protein
MFLKCSGKGQLTNGLFLAFRGVKSGRVKTLDFA